MFFYKNARGYSIRIGFIRMAIDKAAERKAIEIHQIPKDRIS